MSERVPQSIAKRVVFRAFLASDHVSVATGKTIAITISKNGGAFGNPAAGATNATEIASGFYYFDLGTGDTGTLGPLAYRGAEGTIDDVGDVFTVTDELIAIKADTAAILDDTGTSGVVVAAGSKSGYALTPTTGLGNQTADITGSLSGSVGSVTGAVGSVTTVSDKTGYRLSATGVDDVLDEVVEGSYTLRQYLRGFAAALLAKVSGAATTTVVIRDTGDSKNRVSATVDADGNRTAVTLDLT